MIQPTSIPYEIIVYDVSSQNLHPDGTPKAEEPQLVTKLMAFPQEVIDRIHVMTDNVRFRHFVKGSPLINIDWAWSFQIIRRRKISSDCSSPARVDKYTEQPSDRLPHSYKIKSLAVRSCMPFRQIAISTPVSLSLSIQIIVWSLAAPSTSNFS